MSLNPSLIPVKKITSSQARSTFPSEVIEQAAKAILEAEGTINPIVVRQISLREFEVIEGHLEYYAAVRAREIDLERAEMIDAIVVQPENEAAILEQIQLLRPHQDSEKVDRTTSDSSTIEYRLNNLEKQIETQLGDLGRKLLELQQQNQQIQRNSQQQKAELAHNVADVIQEQLSTTAQYIIQEVRKPKPPILSIEELEKKVKTEGYEKLSSNELKRLASGRGLEGRSKYTTKAALITFLKQSASN